MDFNNELELKLQRFGTSGAIFYICQPILKYKILEIGKTYKIKILDEVKQ